MDESAQPDNALIQNSEVVQLRLRRKQYLDGLTPPYSEEEQTEIKKFDDQILEATAKAIERRKDTGQ